MRNSKKRNAHPIRRNRRSNKLASRVQYGRLSTAAINSAGKELAALQQALESGEIDSDEFESRMEELESRSRAGRRACVLHRARMAITRQAGSEDLALLQSAISTLSKATDAGEKVALLRDIAQAAAEMAKELGA